MFLLGNVQQTGNPIEGKSPIITHRKRSVDLVRQAQFAACSYLGYDPYEEKHQNGIIQVSACDNSVPVELHLHHHHHHHCREGDDIMRRPTPLQSSTDSPLGVGSLLSICDHIQLFQDAWQGHARVEEKPQKFMVHNSMFKRDATFNGVEGSLPTNSDKKDTLRERNFPTTTTTTERYWSGTTGVGCPQPNVGTEVPHVNTSARISHWECSVVQEEKFTKGCGVGIRNTERGRASAPNEDVVTDYMVSSTDFGWTSAPKFASSNQTPSTPGGLKADRTSSSGSNVAGTNNQDIFSSSGRKSGSTVTKRKKSFSDAEMSDDQNFMGSSETSWQSTADTRNHSQAHNLSECSRKILGLSPRSSVLQQPRNHAHHDGCNFQSGEKSSCNLESISTRMGKKNGIIQKQSGSACEECTCQRSRLRSSVDGKLNGMGSQMASHFMSEDLRDDSNLRNKHYDLREKIISLDETENGDVHSPRHLSNCRSKTLHKKQNQIHIGRDGSMTDASSNKVSEDCNGFFSWDDSRVTKTRPHNAEKNNEMSSNNGRQNDHCISQGFLPSEKEQANRASKSSFTEDRIMKISANDNRFHGTATSPSEKGPEKSRTRQEFAFQTQANEENCYGDGPDGTFTWQQSHSIDFSPVSRACKIDRCSQGMRSEKYSLKPEDSEIANKRSSSETVVKRNTVCQTDYSALGVAQGPIKVTENGHSTPLPKCESHYVDTFSDGHLEYEKIRREPSKKELEHIKDFDDLFSDLVSQKDTRSSISDVDSLSKTSSRSQEKEKRRLALELEARHAAEEKARIYEASAEAAESRLLQLLDERTKLHLKFDEELEQKEVERMRLHSLFEKEKMKSEAVKKELLDLKEKFSSMMNNVPMSPRAMCNEYDQGLSKSKLQNDAEEALFSPRGFSRSSGTMEKHDLCEERKDQSTSAMHGRCTKMLQKLDQIESGHLSSTEKTSAIPRTKESCILQQVRQQEMQLKTAEDAFHELERRLKHVDIDKATPKECSEYGQYSSNDSRNKEKSTQTVASTDAVYGKYSCVYQSPIFEPTQTTSENLEGLYDAEPDEKVPRGKEDETDVEIRQLTEELKTIGADMLTRKVTRSSGNQYTEQDKQINDGEMTNQMLRKQLKEKNAQLNKTLAQHAKELQKVQNSSTQVHQLNKQLANNLEKSESKLLEVQQHYDSLLASVESQLKEAKENVENLNQITEELRQALSASNEMVSECEKRAIESEKRASEYEKRASECEKRTSECEKRTSECEKRASEYENMASEYEKRASENEKRASESEKRASEYEKRASESEKRASENEKRASENEKRASESEKRASESEKRASDSERWASDCERRACDSERRASESDRRACESDRRACDSDRRACESDKRAAQFKECAEQKEDELEDLRRTTEHIEKERDCLSKGKNELSVKLQEAQREIDEQTARVAEYLSINEELLDFAQCKENEVNSLRKQLQCLQQEILEKTETNNKLQSDLEKARHSTNEMQKTFSTLESENENLKSRVSESKVQLLQQEGTIGTLTKQMADIMEGRDSMLEEAAQFHGYLQNAKYKEIELESKLRQSTLVIKDLEDKIQILESDQMKTKLELSNLRNQNCMLQKVADEKEQDAQHMRGCVNDLRKKVQDLEEEVLLKEGQIAIISSQNREHYESF